MSVILFRFKDRDWDEKRYFTFKLPHTHKTAGSHTLYTNVSVKVKDDDRCFCLDSIKNYFIYLTRLLFLSRFDLKSSSIQLISIMYSCNMCFYVKSHFATLPYHCVIIREERRPHNYYLSYKIIKYDEMQIGELDRVKQKCIFIEYQIWYCVSFVFNVCPLS